jgi:hypothetical protein
MLMSFQTISSINYGYAIVKIDRYDGLATEQKSLYYVFVWVYANLCTVTVIEFIVFS